MGIFTAIAQFRQRWTDTTKVKLCSKCKAIFKRILKELEGLFDDWRDANYHKSIATIVEIPKVKLSKTFKEAILVADYFGLDYLWIDSLCILQDADDRQDWEQESVKMSDIYGRSSLNIAASGAADASAGCFFDRDDEDFDRIKKVRVPIGEDEGSTLFWDCGSGRTYTDAMSTSPLSARGWCFQERFLAPRTIHFTKSQIFWECEGLRACETFPKRLPKEYWVASLKPPTQKLFSPNQRDQVCRDLEILQHDRHFYLQGQLMNFLGRGPVGSLADMWAQVVGLYSKTQLSIVSDKLVAISGIAKWFQIKNKDEYVGGMWRKYLEAQLLWHSSADSSDEAAYHLAKPTEYLAPSWSWASTNRTVEYVSAFDIQDFNDDEQRWSQNVTVLEVSTTPTVPDSPLGGLKAGSLCLKFSKMYVGTAREFDRVCWTLCWDYPANEQDMFYFLPVLHCCDSYDSELCFHEGLILEFVESREPMGSDLPSTKSVFRRVGYWVKNRCGLYEKEADLEEYEQIEFNGEKCHVLRVI
ncbi:heterokaryon incompatibility protein domain-containing protein [Trichoderma ceciliae]